MERSFCSNKTFYDTAYNLEYFGVGKTPKILRKKPEETRFFKTPISEQEHLQQQISLNHVIPKPYLF